MAGDVDRYDRLHAADALGGERHGPCSPVGRPRHSKATEASTRPASRRASEDACAAGFSAV
ncbi:hypothetical protein GCM10009727_79290 [Actinomadura napierensis]|uniref:Uncharacterized protein n=1 Tax=Actinomadura napierensis TaxID=267854 RepID=A0ABN3AFB2_9ACTN